MIILKVFLFILNNIHTKKCYNLVKPLSLFNIINLII